MSGIAIEITKAYRVGGVHSAACICSFLLLRERERERESQCESEREREGVRREVGGGVAGLTFF